MRSSLLATAYPRLLKSAATSFAFLLACLCLAAQAAENHAGTIYHSVTGDAVEYTVQPDDYLIKISARFGMPAKILAEENNLDYAGILRPGNKLFIHSQHIVPDVIEDGILINLPQRMLFFFQARKLAGHYPVGLGRPDWPTPTSRFKVANMQVNKDWLVPKSIQEEMRREGKAVQARVPPGPDNPLGKHWIGLNLPGYGIHGTIAPASVFHFQSHGCIRLHPDDIEMLFGKVNVGTQGMIIYVPVLLARLPDGRIFLEVHRDIYEQAGDPLETAHRLAEANGLAQQIDWERVAEVVRRQVGMARDVTL